MSLFTIETGSGAQLGPPSSQSPFTAAALRYITYLHLDDLDSQKKSLIYTCTYVLSTLNIARKHRKK